jgi:hypothetical protein
MVPKEGSWSIVINGHWNRMIFTPKWVGNKVFKLPAIERLVSMVPTNPVIYQNEEIILAVAEEKLTITLRKLTAKCMLDAESKVTEILDLLSHTPVSAIGVNFGFIEDSPLHPLLKLFNYADNTEVASVTASDNQQSKLTRTLKSEEKILNFSLSFDGSSVEFGANYHHNVESAATAIAEIKDKTILMHKSFLELLKKVYKLTFTEEISNG